MEWKGEHPAVRPVQNVAEQPAESPHIRASSRHIARRDQDLRLVAPPPELFQKHRPVRKIRVHRHDIRRSGIRKTRKQRASISALPLDHHACPPSRCSLRSPISRTTVHHQNFDSETDGRHHFLHGRNQEIKVLSLVQRRNYNSQPRRGGIRVRV